MTRTNLVLLALPIPTWWKTIHCLWDFQVGTTLITSTLVIRWPMLPPSNMQPCSMLPTSPIQVLSFLKEPEQVMASQPRKPPFHSLFINIQTCTTMELWFDPWTFKQNHQSKIPASLPFPHQSPMSPPTSRPNLDPISCSQMQSSGFLINYLNSSLSAYTCNRQWAKIPISLSFVDTLSSKRESIQLSFLSFTLFGPPWLFIASFSFC